MSLWIELRCDGHWPGCLSAMNEGPRMLVENAYISVSITRLKREALRAGWTYTMQRWRCPSCSKQEQ